MESRFNNKDFEQFVKQNADQYRMFPSEKVWKGIHATLHTRRWVYSLGFGLLLLSAGVMTWLMMNSSASSRSLLGKPVASVLQNNYTASTEKNPNSVANNSFIPGMSRNSFFIPAPAHEQKETFTAVVESPVVSNNNDIETAAPVISHPVNTSTETNPPANIEKTSSPSAFNLSGLSIDNNLSPNSKEKNEFSLLNEERDQNPMSIESVLNSYHRMSHRSKISMQFNFVPTISYRKLKENKAAINSSQVVTGPYGYVIPKDVNSVVTHKPDMGLELGFTAGYPLSKDFRIIAGLQFNVSRYEIKAYSHSTETATIALSTDGGFNYVTPATNYRNFDGYKQDWLKNLYFSVSMPIGAELLLGGNDRAYLGMAATIQPTYVIGDQAYLISTDYKNYAEVPSLMRKWNVNTSFETFAGYSTGRIKWKVGPQVRYQVLSSFQEKYPVKEHLFDFGLKVGIMLNR